ncbi:YafY family protein [Labrenzia sp. PHM005]|uniref:helix-turn-helix transcriptional regulator n=1 Tax=Labrenzia sp. PHM005 TaxID=2590016 RepID=UPI0011403D10|nr:YafY family protein [Labrenzia sp. PHM005]QDG76755.1 YafY family transcriptional regulator [Labrenzia sp. PHM005]
MRTLRLFSILDILRSRRSPVSAATLAEMLSVTERTVYRDMATLKEMGAPIRGEGGIGYVIERGYFLPPLQFDPDELDVVLLGLQMIKARSDKDMQAAAERALGKIGAVLNDQDRNFNRPLLAVGSRSSAEGQDALSPLRSAIRSRHKLLVHYKDGENRLSERTVRPLGLTAFEKVWVLTAWCEKREDFRNFRLDRIADFQQTGTRFPIESGREFHDYLRTL